MKYPILLTIARFETCLNMGFLYDPLLLLINGIIPNETKIEGGMASSMTTYWCFAMMSYAEASLSCLATMFACRMHAGLNEMWALWGAFRRNRGKKRRQDLGQIGEERVVFLLS